MLSLIFMLSMFGCGDKIEDTADGIVTRDEDPIPESDPDDQPWGYEPDMVLFHNVTIVEDGNIGCFDDGDDTPYCGVHKIYLTVWDDWDGLGDQGSCEITHRVAPEYLVESTANDDLVEVGALVGWEMDAAQTFVATSNMCDFIREGTTGHSVLEKFKTQNLVWGFIPPTEEMIAEYKENHSDTTEEEWVNDVEPYLSSYVNVIDGLYRVPNMTVSYETDETNNPVVDDDDNWTAQPLDNTTMPNGYYRSPPFYVYSIERFVDGE